MATLFYKVFLQFFSLPSFLLPSSALNNLVPKANLVATLLFQSSYEYKDLPRHPQRSLWKSTGDIQHSFLFCFLPLNQLFTQFPVLPLNLCLFSSFRRFFWENFEYKMPFQEVEQYIIKISFICMLVTSFKRPQQFSKTWLRIAKIRAGRDPWESSSLTNH